MIFLVQNYVLNNKQARVSCGTLDEHTKDIPFSHKAHSIASLFRACIKSPRKPHRGRWQVCWRRQKGRARAFLPTPPPRGRRKNSQFYILDQTPFSEGSCMRWRHPGIFILSSKRGRDGWVPSKWMGGLNHDRLGPHPFLKACPCIYSHITIDMPIMWSPIKNPFL